MEEGKTIGTKLQTDFEKEKLSMINITDIENNTNIHESKELNENFMTLVNQQGYPHSHNPFPLTDKIGDILGLDDIEDFDYTRQPQPDDIEEQLGVLLYKFTKLGYGTKVEEMETEKEDKINGLAMRDLPSELFIRYIEKHYETDYIMVDIIERGVNLEKLLQYNVYEIKKCKNIMESKGHFANYLWNGDIDGVFSRADGNHQKWAEVFVKQLDNERFDNLMDEIKWYFNHEPTWKYEWYMNRLAKKNNLEDGVIIKRNGYYRKYYDPNHDYHLELTEEGSA